MPSTESIEQIHEQLTPLGDEPRVAAERGEIIEPPRRPDESLDDDLSALLDDTDADSENLAREQDEVSGSDDDTSALLSNLDSLFDADDESEEGAQAEDAEDEFDLGDFDLGDDDVSVPPDFSFNPDEIPDELPDEDQALEDLLGADDEASDDASLDDGTPEESALEEPDEFGDDELSADAFADDESGGDESGGDEFSTDEAPSPEDGESDEDILSAFSDDVDADPFADLAALDQEQSDQEQSDQEPQSADGEPADTGFADDELGELGLSDDAFLDDELGEPEVSEAAFPDDDASAEPEELTAEDEPDELPDDEASVDEDAFADLNDLDDLDDIAGDDSFGADFGEQIDEDFGDIDVDDSELSDEPLDDLGGGFELPSVDDEIEDLDSVDDFDAIEEEGFSLGDFGEEFDINEESIDEFAGLEEGIDEAAEEVEEAVAAGEPIERELSDEEFSHLQQTLASLPLNVRIAAEEVVGESKGTPDQVNQVIDQLIAGASPAKIAQTLSRVLDRKVEVPKGYQKRTGVAFEEEKRTFAYRFQHVILPALRTAMLVTLATAVVGFLAYRFVYRPIHAAVLYRQGYEYAQQDRFELANETFVRAYELRPRNHWFGTYAELYVEKRRYQLAVEKYDQLVFGMNAEERSFLRGMVADNRLIEEVQVAPGRFRQVYELLTVDREAILDHGRLQSDVLANYRRADELYRILLFGNESDYDALIARGDNYMRWGEEVPERFEDARTTYARLLSYYGDTDPILMRFLRYFVRMDNQERVEELVDIFQRSPDSTVEPQIYANAAGYLLDKGRITGVRDMLIRSYQEDELVPEVHYELARYNRRIDAPIEERDALDNARQAFRLAEPLSPDRLMKQIDTDIRSGEYWFEREELLTATEELSRAQSRYEDAVEAGFLSSNPELARVYARLADIDYFYSGEFDRALRRYDRAAADGYVTDDLNFKRGFLHYRESRYEQAAAHFFNIGATNDLVGPNNVLYARANTLYQRGNYYGSEAFYQELLERLEQRRDTIRTLLVEEDPAHRALVENLIRVHNNLGVAMYRAQVREDPTDPDVSGALNHLRTSTELRENYLREDETGERAQATSLAFLNIREILYPTERYDPQIFSELPRTIEQPEL